MNSEKCGNIYRMMSTYNFTVVGKDIVGNLECGKCKSLLKDAYQVPCGCRFCRTCIGSMMTSGNQFCPGISEECSETFLSAAAPDYSANKSIFNLVVKCPHNGCELEFPLNTIQEHLRVCSRKISECPFHELGCKQDNIFPEEINGHFLRENRSHSEILIGMIANINNEVDLLKCRDEGSRKDIELLKRTDEKSQKEIELLKQKEERSQKEIELLKQKDEKSWKEIEMIKQRDENSRKEIEILKRELVLKDERIKTLTNESNQIVLKTQDEIKLIKVLVGLVDANCEWVSHENVAKATWSWGDRTSGYFTGVVHPYKFQLISLNNNKTGGTLSIRVVIYAGPNDDEITWPFNGTVVIIISDKNKRDKVRNITRQCRIERPPNIGCNYSEPFDFSHSELTAAGLNLDHGICVSCQIMPCTSR